jgi:hypothetical protein
MQSTNGTMQRASDRHSFQAKRQPFWRVYIYGEHVFSSLDIWIGSNGFRKCSDLGPRRLVMLAAVKFVCNLANVRDTYSQLETHPDDEPGRRVRVSSGSTRTAPPQQRRELQESREPKLESTSCRPSGHSDVAL